MAVLERMFTRALRGSGAGLGNAAPGTGYTGSRRGSSPGSTNPGAGRGNTKNPVAGTRSITYNSPGQPLPLDIAADQLSQEDYLQSVYVMRCVRLIAETIAASPFVVGPNPFDPGNYDLDAPLARLLGPATPQAPGGPNPHLTSRAFWIWTIIQYITSGRWGWELQWDAQPEAARSNIIALWPLISIALAPIPIDGKTDIWAGFQYQTPTGFVQMTPQRVCYAWRPSIADWRMPESVLQSAHNAIYMQRALERYMVNLLKNNMVATTMVISPPFEESDQRRAWEDQFLAEYTGVDRAGGTIFGYVEHDEEDRADKPLVQVERIAQTAVEASLADLSRTAKDDICVLPGTGIVTKRGVVPVENVVVGDEVVTHQGRWRKVVATMVSQPSAPVVELRSPGLEPLSLTSNHPVYAAHYARTHADTAQQFQGHDWVAAGSLRAGRGHRKWHGLTVPALVEADGGHLDIAALHQLGRRGNFTLADADGVLSFGHRRANPIPSTLKLTPALGRLLGLYLAEGSTNGHQVTWYLHEDELDLQRQIHADTMEVFGLPVTVRPAAEGRCVRVTLSSSLAVPVFKSGNARTKAVPAWAWDGDADFMREVLWGWIQGDGSHDEKVSRGFTASRSLAWHMRLIAISLGHRASIRPVTQTASRIYGRDIAAGGLGWVVSWANRNEAAAGHGLIYRLEAGALSSPLRSVTALDYAGPVHNLSVEEDESYLTVGGMVHNCIALGVPRSLLGDASQRIYANSDAEYRNFWTITMLNLIAEIQDHVNLRLAPRIDPGAVGWFDLSKVVALQPPSIFAPPDVAEAINLGILSPQQAATLLNIPPPGTQGDTDVQTAPIGEELMAGIGMSGRADLGRRLEQWGFRSDFDAAPWVEVRQRVQMNSYLYREPWKRMGPKVELRPRIRAYEGVRQAELVRERTAGLRAVAMARATAQKVHRSLAKHYPDEVLDWVDGADWEGPTRVPLEDIDMARRPGGRDMGKVDSIAKAIAEDPDGPAAAPVVLVKTPSGSLKVADGYHRTLAHKRMGHKSVPAYVGTVDDDEGPWDREMHDAKLNRSASITVPTHELATRAMDVWYGTGGTAQLPPPRVVDVAEILNEAHPYVVESADHFNGIPNHVVDELAEKLNEAGALDEDDQPVTGVASTKVTQPTATVG